MKIIKTIKLEKGMVTAAPVKTRHGQLIADEGVALTDELISRISFYGIDCIRIIDADDKAAPEKQSIPKPIGKGNVQAPTYSQKIKNSREFQRFQFDYSRSTGDLKNNLSSVLSEEDKTFNKNELLQSALPLLAETHSSIEMFDMLHNMRAVNDSIYAHSLNVALISGMFGKWLKLPKEELDTLVLAALLHDIGKTKIPEEILNKPGKYTDEEFELVQQHPALGYQILNTVPDQLLDPRIKKAALMHHERCDGTGYPNGLKGSEIDDFAQIIAIADVYDAMTAARSYRAPLCPFQVIAAFERDGLQKYNPKYILTFLEHIATTYQNNRVLLNDGRGCNIVLLNKQSLSKPIVQLDDGSCIDLSRTPELNIQSLL